MLELSISEPKQLIKVSHALSSELRINIIGLLMSGNMNIIEIAAALDIPVSTAASNIKVLESSGLIITELVPASRGSMKICRRNFDDIHMKLTTIERFMENVYEIEMPIGHFIDCEVVPSCGMANENQMIILEDDATTFFHPNRTSAQLIWFRKGYLEYRFPLSVPAEAKINSIEFSAEICSEAPNFDMNWPSDITAWVNGVEIGTWTSPSDFGGRKGKLNPAWWTADPTRTQYGILKTWKVDHSNCYVDNHKVRSIGISELNLVNNKFVTFRIGVKEDAVHKGGMNLFGKKFGDHAQDIWMKCAYTI